MSLPISQEIEEMIKFMRVNAAYEKSLGGEGRMLRAVYFSRTASVIEGLHARTKKLDDDCAELREILLRKLCTCNKGIRCDSCITTMKLFGTANL